MESTHTTQRELSTVAVSALQGEAWAAWNASYTDPQREAYRIVSLALYRQDVHERIERLFSRSDEQNSRMEKLGRG